MKTLFTFSVFLIGILNLQAQKEATTNDGKKVILNDDGTWLYKEAVKTATITGSSDCANFIDSKTDKMTGKTTTAAKGPIIVSKDAGKTGFYIILMKSTDGLILSIKATGAGGCIDDDGKMNVLFRDGTRIELSNDGGFNCDSRYTQYFGGLFGKEFELEQFKTHDIETIRVWTSKGYVEQDFSVKQSQQIKQTVNCLLQ